MKPILTDLPMTTENVKLLLARFKCQRCEDSCCLKVTAGAMLKEGELYWLPAELTHIKDGKRFLNIPCPFYRDGCTIYSIRPQVCRQYPFNRSDSQGNITINPNCPAGRELG